MSTKKGSPKSQELVLYIIALVILSLGLVFFVFKNATTEPMYKGSGDVLEEKEEHKTPSLDNKGDEVAPEITPEVTPEPTPEPTPVPSFEPYYVEHYSEAIEGEESVLLSTTNPSNLIKYTNISIDGVTMEDGVPYEAIYPINFDFGENYTDVEGIVTFRGNNFRDGGSYGVANMTNQKFAPNTWSITTSSLQAPNGSVWTGSGWVGQPLCMTWDKETRSHMNMYDWAKSQEKLTEVIYATMDGYVYFMELETGKATRDKLFLGFTFKGSGALDPRGYPILYVGAGYDSSLGRARVFIVNLLDCSTMYTFGNDDNFSLRGNLTYFDGSALIDAETDQLIYPGESGVMYIMKLNTNYDKENGTLSINPENVVRWRYMGTRTSLGSYWLGMESSPIIWQGHIFMCDNGGNFMCLDLNTLELKWVQDCLDDTNCTPVLEIEDGHPYLYLSTSFHGGWREPMWSEADIPIWKIDGVTGEIVWQTNYRCFTQDGVSGGVQGTLATGKGELENLIYVPVAMVGDANKGVLTALNKETGEIVWEHHTGMYSWSSPVCFYDQNGHGYVIICTAGGYIYLLDGLTGEQLDARDLGRLVEASPIVYNNTIVVGLRDQHILGITLT